MLFNRHAGATMIELPTTPFGYMHSVAPIRSLAIFLVLMICASQCQSQFRPPQVDLTEKDSIHFTFLDTAQNNIENAGHLTPLLEKLYEQRVRGGKRINVVHIGDSHILGNFLTREIRARLQEEFGDGGRGLIFPYKLAGSNGPRDYKIQTTNSWSGSNCQQNLARETPFGISGFQLESFRKSGKLIVNLRDTSTSQTRLFTKLTIFHQPSEAPVRLKVWNEVTNQEAILYLQDEYSRSYYFDHPVAQATITYEQSSEKLNSFVLDGILLENEYAGLVYHSIGVNGGKFSDFVRAQLFARQLADLNPDLVILSFGTNEAQGKISTQYIYKQIEALVGEIKKYSPQAYILLTTPADSYLKGRGYNPYMARISEVIRQFAKDNNFALWDLFGLGGGSRSAQNWKYSGLLSRDSVHYSKLGYAVQGKLLYLSLIRSYNNYVEKTLTH